MNGQIIDPNMTIDWTNITYSITKVNTDSTGTLKFSNPVNFTWLKENYHYSWSDPNRGFFRVYWRDVDFYNNNQNKSLLEFDITDFGDDNMTINFTLTFD
jgi:hypothetical protein